MWLFIPLGLRSAFPHSFEYGHTGLAPNFVISTQTRGAANEGPEGPRTFPWVIRGPILKGPRVS